MLTPRRQDTTATMAILYPREVASDSPMGDAVRRMVAEHAQVTVPRLLFRNDGEPWNAYILHDNATDPLLVRIYEFGKRYGIHSGCWSILEWLRKRYDVPTAASVSSITAHYNVRLSRTRIRLPFHALCQRSVSGNVQHLAA